MGASVSSMQILGVPEDTVRAALPGALVGTWSKRFVTACLGPDFMETERKARSLSKKLQCTVLAVSLIDGDTLRLMLYQSGKNLTYHIALPKYGTHKAGNSALFCSVLGLPEALAPKLKRLFAVCPSQEEKLSILQALLGAPLFIRYGAEEDGYLPQEPVKADSGPLEEWAREHPEAPKIKNQCRAELIQEIPDLFFHGDIGGRVFLLRPLAIAGEEEASWGGKAGEVIGVETSGGKLAYPLPDGHLELTQLEDPPISQALEDYLFDGKSVSFDHFSYAFLDGRLVIAADFFEECDYQSYSPYQTVLLHDTAGILPCYLPLTLEGRPVIARHFYLLPDGGFLVSTAGAAWARYGPDGTLLYTAGSDAGLRDGDAAGLRAIQKLKQQIGYSTPVVDSQGRLWQYHEKYFECYFPKQKLISRHRLPGCACALYLNDIGQACAITSQDKKHLTRVYRFSCSKSKK